MVHWADAAISISNGIFLSFVAGIPFYAAYKKINVFDSFIEGAKQGFETVLMIVPYLVGMLVAIGMLRASGFFETVSLWLGPVLNKVGVPPEILPLVFVRPFSGGASTGIMAELIQHYGGNAYISRLAGTIMGSTETTFYVIAVYFGSVGIRHTRHAIPAGLIADAAGVVAAVIVCHFLYSWS